MARADWEFYRDPDSGAGMWFNNKTGAQSGIEPIFDYEGYGEARRIDAPGGGDAREFQNLATGAWESGVVDPNNPAWMVPSGMAPGAAPFNLSPEQPDAFIADLLPYLGMAAVGSAGAFGLGAGGAGSGVAGSIGSEALIGGAAADTLGAGALGTGITPGAAGITGLTAGTTAGGIGGGALGTGLTAGLGATSPWALSALAPLTAGGTLSALSGGAGGTGTTAATQAAGGALSRILDGTATADDWLSIAGKAAPGVISAFGSAQQANTLQDIADRARADRQPFLDKSLAWLNDPQGYAEGPGASVLQGVLRKLSATHGNPIGSPTALGIATEAGLNDWRNAYTGAANLGLAGEDTRARLETNAAGESIWPGVADAVTAVTHKPSFNLADFINGKFVLA